MTRLFLTAHALLVAFLAGVPVSAAPAEYNLSSRERTLSAPAAGTIKVGTKERAIQINDLLTPSELVALKQVSGDRKQTLVLNNAGMAIGGRFDLADLSEATSLVVPTNVTALANFSRIGAFSLTGSLVNNGNIYGYATASGAKADFEAANVVNNEGGLITTKVPFEKLGIEGAVTELDLRVNATQELSNQGNINSSGRLSIGSSGSIK